MGDNIDKTDGFINFEIGGEIRKMRFSMHSATQIKKLLGKNPMKQIAVTEEEYKKLSEEEKERVDNDPNKIDIQDPEEITAFIWSLLITDSEDLDGFISKEGEPDKDAKSGLRQVSKWLDSNTMKRAFEAITSVMGLASLPQEDEEVEEEKKL